MTHHQLMSVLQECPESPYFGRDDYNLTEEKARQLVLAFVERANFNSHAAHVEVDSSNENSSNLRVSQNQSGRLGADLDGAAEDAVQRNLSQ